MPAFNRLKIRKKPLLLGRLARALNKNLFLKILNRILSCYEHSEQARAPHTNGPRNVPRCGALVYYKRRCTTRGVMVVLMPLFVAALVVLRRYFIVAPRPFPAAAARCASQVLDHCAHVDARGATRVLDRGVQAVARGAARCALHGARTDACGRSFAVLSTQVSTVGLRLRLVVPRPMPAAVASRWCRRRFQQLACA